MVTRAPRVVRLRPLTAAQQQRLEALRHTARLLDSAFQVPGTTYRIGLDPILGLVPGIGDLVSPIFTIGILWQGHDLGISRVVLVRMLGNVLVDAAVGAVPIVGDLFDFAWKANERNLALLELHATEERAPSGGDWVFVAALTALILIIAAIPFVLTGLLLWALVGWLR